MKTGRVRWIATGLALAFWVGAAPAQTVPAPASLGESRFAPRVPVSALAQPLAWFDASRLRVGTSVAFGSGFGGGVDGLQVTRLSYRFNSPVWLSVSLANSFGASAAKSGRSFFLEGFDLSYRPSPSLLFQVRYHDLRSPLQLSPYANELFWGP